MDSINRDLKSIYKNHFPKLKNILNEEPGLIHPLLLQVPKGYQKQPSKLMVFGQQTRGWCEGDIKGLLNCYKEFNLGGRLNRTPFWNFIRKLEKRLSIESRKIVWNNLNKCAFENGRPNRELERHILKKFPVILDEIKSIQPDKVLFLTGPTFDDHIMHIFQGCSFLNIEGCNKRKFCKVSHPSLPTKTFRTYHPNYLRQSRLEEKYFNKLIKLLN